MLGSIASWALVAIAGMALAVIGSQWAVRHASMLAHGLSIPPFLLGLTFFALGTDIPEIATSVMSAIDGQGDVFGACLTDASLSIAAGPAVAPTAVTASLAIRGGLFAIVAMLLATMVLWKRQSFDRWSGAALLAEYGIGYLVL